MKRRAFFAAVFPAAAAQKFGASNLPRCPVCHTEVPADTPAYLPLIQNASDGTNAALPNLREMICTNCGNMWVTSA